MNATSIAPPSSRRQNGRRGSGHRSLSLLFGSTFWAVPHLVAASDTVVPPLAAQTPVSYWLALSCMLLALILAALALAVMRRAQRTLKFANRQLGERVRQRTAELETSAAQLRESEQRLRFLADSMPQLVWTARPDGIIESVNRGWRGYLGADTEEKVLAMLKDIVHPDDRNTLDQEWSAMLTEGRAASGEIRLRRADGAYRWHLWRAHPQTDVQGVILRWIGTSTDIHDQKIVAEKLEHRVNEGALELTESEERFRQAFELAGIGMAIVSLDGRWLRVNTSITEIIGYTAGELRTKTFQDLTHPDDLAADMAHVWELIEGKRRFYQMEKRYIHRDGHTVWARLTVSVVRDASERPVHFISQLEDITERKRLEASLANARDQALEASRLKSEFLATMSHEIRTPMNGVIGMTALLRDTSLTPTQAEYVRTIETSGESLLTIINDILDYSKIEAGRIELEMTPFDLRECVEEALDLFAARAAEKKIELVYQMSAATPSVVAGDATRLRQILVNLVGNALKFTDAGEVIVIVEAPPVGSNPPHPHPSSGTTRRYLRFAVKDTGIGIRPEGMARLFKSFSQVDASTTRRFGGTGLGLAISKRLAELMGGTMWVESKPGEGATFHFTIVVELSPAFAPESPTSKVNLAGRHLLLVDDHPASRRNLATLATAWGMHVHEAASGREALDLLVESSGFDVAAIDLHMPDMDGEQLGAKIRALPASAKLPLVLLAPLGRPARSHDFAQSLSKPVKAEALRAAFHACLRAEHPSDMPQAATRPGQDGTLGQRHPLRLLVAEDNPVNQRVASLILQRLGYRPAIVANGLEAISALQLADYEVILMDIEMPELDGCEATRRIRLNGGTPTKPWIIALTAGAMLGDRERALAAGMNDFLTKPVRTEALAAALARAHAGLHGVDDVETAHA